jgi:ABC-2 type transport system ATP-binding protein
VSESIIEVRSLRREFGKLTAVDNVSFEVGRGEVFGFLGPNGAGKTTTINMLCTLLKPTAGAATVNGFDVDRQRSEVRRSIGLVFQQTTLDEYLTAEQNLRFHAYAYAVPAGVREPRIKELLTMVELWDRRSGSVRTFSGGMKRRLEIARGLLHHPKVLFLDEPTIGLDPVGARELRQLVSNLIDAGKTVLLTTHYMFEADALCDRIAVIAKGRIVAEGTPEALKANVADATVVEIETFGVADDALERLRAISGVSSVGVEDREQAQVLAVQLSAGLELTQSLLAALGETQVGRVSSREPTLEDAYVALVTAAEDEAAPEPEVVTA